MNHLILFLVILNAAIAVVNLFFVNTMVKKWDKAVSLFIALACGSYAVLVFIWKIVPFI
jgi:hypothetical protein